jgi:hypothetical protein
MKIEQEHPTIMDPETEAKELENALHDMSKAVREANKKPGKSGLSYSEFKAHFLTTIVKTSDLAHTKNH